MTSPEQPTPSEVPNGKADDDITVITDSATGSESTPDFEAAHKPESNGHSSSNEPPEPADDDRTMQTRAAVPGPDTGSAALPPWQRVTSDVAHVQNQHDGQASAQGPAGPAQASSASSTGRAQAGGGQPTVGAGDATTRFEKKNWATAPGRSEGYTKTDQAGFPTAAEAGGRTTVNFAGVPIGTRSGPSSTPSALRRPGRGPRRASLQVKRIDPWSVLKLAFVLSVALFFVWLVAVGVLYGVLEGMGVWDKLNGTYNEFAQNTSGGGSGPLITVGRVFGFAAIIGAINIVLITALATVGAFVYNISADLAGGLEITLTERE